MRFSQTPPNLLSLLLVALSAIKTAQSWPLGALDISFLQDRSCASFCGADNQYCCTAGQACTTNAGNIAACVDATGVSGGGYAVYTTTYTETDLNLRTSTWSSYYGGASTSWAPAATPAICTPGLGQTSCGSICCASNQRCAAAESCVPLSTSWTTYATSAAGSSSYSPPLRPTSGGVSTATSVVSATTTQPFIPPATASGSTIPITSGSSSKGLSGGAIAGIVIGVIAGIILLILLCFCCILKAGFDGLLALFGLGGRNRRRSTERVEVVERYSRHGSGTASRRDTHTGWFGGASRPARVTETRKKRTGGFGGLGAVGAGLLGLAVVLGLKRKHDRKEKSSAARSDISSTYYTDSYTGTSASSASSDRRTRTTRHSRR